MIGKLMTVNPNYAGKNVFKIPKIQVIAQNR